MKNGFTLLLSVLIVSIVLAVGVGISRIIQTEIFLSNTGRQSQMAFYAADAGLECVAYWDTIHPGLAKSAFTTTTPATNSITCVGQSFQVGGYPSCTPSACTTPADKRQGVTRAFTLNFTNGSCVKITVTKREDYSDPTRPEIETFIRTDGQSTCAANAVRIFQRSLVESILGDE